MANSVLCPRLRGGGAPFTRLQAAPCSARVDRCWNGRKAGDHLATEVRCGWDEERIYFQFAARISDLCVNEAWARDESVYGLWETDVVEVFLRPEISEAYFEFEVSPLGRWLDALVRRPRVDVDFGWQSGIQVQCEIQPDSRVWTAQLAIPFTPMMTALRLGLRPQAGNVWKINLFRISGAEPARDYLAWQPTFTPRPDFHVPEAFGNLILAE